MSVSQPINIFPQSTRYDPATDAVAGNPTAPICNGPKAGAGRWSIVTLRVEGASVERVTLSIPSNYNRTDTDPHRTDVLAPGTRIRWHTPEGRQTSLDLWLSSRASYPTVGAAVGATQFQFAECRALSGHYTVWIARFGVREYQQQHYFVAAYCPVGTQAVIQAFGTALDEGEQSLQFAILGTMRAHGSAT